MQKYPTPKEIKQMTTEELRAASAAARRDVEELWDRGAEGVHFPPDEALRDGLPGLGRGSDTSGP